MHDAGHEPGHGDEHKVDRRHVHAQVAQHEYVGEAKDGAHEEGGGKHSPDSAGVDGESRGNGLHQGEAE